MHSPFDALNFDLLLQEQRLLRMGEALAPLTGLERAKPWRATLDQLQADVTRAKGFRVGFIGNIKAGKSTLLNALLQGEIRLPVAAKVCTAALTRLRGADTRALVAQATPIAEEDLHFFEFLVDGKGSALDFLRGRRPGTAPKDLAEAVKALEARLVELGEDIHTVRADARKILERRRALKGPLKDAWPPSPNDLLQTSNLDLDRWASAQGALGGLIREIDIQWPGGYLPAGAVLVDTPGLQDPVPSRSRATHLAMRELDAIVMCVKGPLLKQHLEELRGIRALGVPAERVVVAHTALDELESAEDQADLSGDLRSRLDLNGWEATPLVPVSALAALHGFLNGPLRRDLLPASYGRTEGDARRLATQCEQALGLAPLPDVPLHERLWRASNLDALLAALARVVASYGSVRRDLEQQVTKDARAIRGGIKFEQARSRQRLALLERIAAGEFVAGGVDLSEEATALKAQVDASGARLEGLEAEGEALSMAAKDLRSERSAVTAELKRNYRPAWGQQNLGGFLWEDGAVALVTDQDPAMLAECLGPHLPDGLPPDLMTATLAAWAAEQGSEIAQRGAEVIAATETFFWNIADADWVKLEAAARAAWTDDGGGYLKALVDSAVDACSAALEVARSGVLAEARDLRKALKADRAALDTRLQADAQDQMVTLKADLLKLGTAFEALGAETASGVLPELVQA